MNDFFEWDTWFQVFYSWYVLSGYSSWEAFFLIYNLLGGLFMLLFCNTIGRTRPRSC